MNINKILIGSSILLGSILIVENLVIGGQAQIIVWYSETGTLTMFSIFIGTMLGYGLKGIIIGEGKKDDYDNEGLNF